MAYTPVPSPFSRCEITSLSAMPISMRKQTMNRKRRAVELRNQSIARKLALKLIEQNVTIRSIHRQTNVSTTTIHRLKKLYESSDQNGLQHMLSESICRGRKPVISNDEAQTINGRLKQAAKRGVAVDRHTFKQVLSRVSADGRNGWKHGVPHEDSIRAYRARFDDIAYKKIENKEVAKIAAESFSHVETFFHTVEEVSKKHPGILEMPSRIWNMDETAVDCTLGKLQRGFTSTMQRSGGFRAVRTKYGVRKHITAVISASASGEVAPPFFIVAGKRVNSDWWQPVTGKFHQKPHGIIAQFTESNWFPGEGVIVVSENGSMEGKILAAYMKHLDAFARRSVRAEDTILLCLDGHASRKDIQWIHECAERNIECVINAANTSHFLQPCDQHINKKFHESLREIRDEFCRQGHVDTAKVNFNLACAVYAWKNIGVQTVSRSFDATGIFPFQRNFAERFKTDEDHTREAVRHASKQNAAGVSTRLKSAQKRKADMDTILQVEEIMKSTSGSSSKLEQLLHLLRHSETISAVLDNSISNTVSSLASNNCSKPDGRRVLYDAGMPAQWVTHADRLKQREARLKREMIEKETKKKREIEESLARLKRKEQAKEDILKRRMEREKNRQEKEEERKRKRRSEEEGRSMSKKKKEERKREESLSRERRVYARKLGKEVAVLCAKHRAKTDDPGLKKGGKGSCTKVTGVRKYQMMAEIILELVDTVSTFPSRP